jgi:hypothetical protein
MYLAARAWALLRATTLWVCLVLAPAAHADLNVGSGGVMSLGSGALDLGCTDINIASTGTLRLDSAVNAA